ncbi:subtilisin-like protease [Macroventuria anomochaeta]|uniref:Subtilisin-like protease n=1 Tax=Macroventuria anomochaeta TaxID=301207 RepID=A0ACB6RW11_9PLEO|nr:subtilisin-like protease [Macroventuria anomochaeta]KAF2626160.1 subtilisin-like protease [Macroventuria anomochaeta]
MHFLGLFAFLSTALAAPFFQAEQAATVIPGQYIIKFKHDEAVVSTRAVKALKESLSTAPKFEYSLSGFNGFAGTLSDAEFAKLQASEHVEYIQRDVKMHAYGLIYQNPATWGISRISHRQPGNSTYIFDDSAGEGTCAYIIDTGIFVDHPDFKGRATHLANFSDEESNEDGEGHGTYGVAKKTQLYSIKVLDSYGSGTTSGIIAGIDFVTRNSTKHNCPKGRVANMSLGGRKNTATNQAVAAAVASGIFFAVAAGNEGVDARYTSPASEPSVCTVGATSMNDTMTSWSNYGSLVDVLAPGANITSLNNDGGTAMHDGTSMASPHVAGLAAYLLGLEGGSTKGLCEKIAKMGLQGVVRNVREGTVNTLSNNGALSAKSVGAQL